MIKASALLVALAIGLLVAGVLASSLLMVYVSIGVCAVAALLLAVGILAHWSDIFGRGESRPSGVQEPWPAVQVQAGTPVLASTQTAGSQATGPQTTGTQTTGTQATGTQVTGAAGRERRRPRREDVGGRPPVPPVEVVPPQADVPAGRGDDLWERVEEELGSAGKRDTGALSWPGAELPVPPESAEAPGQPGPAGTPPGGASAWIWGQGAGWQPPDTPDDAWPPPAAAFAGSPARPESAAPAADSAGADNAGADSPEAGSPEAAGTKPADAEAGDRVPVAAAAEISRKADESAPDARDDAAAGPAPESTPVTRDTWDERPRWIISVGDVPARPVGSSAVPVPPASERAAEPATRESVAAEPQAGEPEREPETGEPEVKTPAVIAPASHEAPAGAAAGQEPASREPAAHDQATREPAAAKADASGPPAQEPAAAKADAGSPADQESAAEEPAADGPAEAPAPGRVEVTVVPGVARYHRSECILIRFLGAEDLEIMTRQEAEEATFVPCRACQPDQLES